MNYLAISSVEVVNIKQLKGEVENKAYFQDFPSLRSKELQSWFC